VELSLILVNEGDSVKKGETIYNLSNAFFSSELVTKEIDLLTFQAVLVRLEA
jgi:adhesin transport system membrane fusion protein